jgi:hypothetical protein
MTAHPILRGRRANADGVAPKKLGDMGSIQCEDRSATFRHICIQGVKRRIALGGEQCVRAVATPYAGCTYCEKKLSTAQFDSMK